MIKSSTNYLDGSNNKIHVINSAGIVYQILLYNNGYYYKTEIGGSAPIIAC